MSYDQPHRLSRRDMLVGSAMAAGMTGLAGCFRTQAPSTSQPGRVLVLGIDGMDPNLLRQFLDAGRMPNCQRLIAHGSFHTLATSNPPQSPVAWSNFISGCNPGVHGIFDFVARDPESMQPYHSTARQEPGRATSLTIGQFVFPVSSPPVRNLRQGPTFWDSLEAIGIDCTILRMPATFPPDKSEAVTLSGMGTPDLAGGYGTFSYFTDDPSQRTRDVGGGRIERIEFENDRATCQLKGPVNEFSVQPEPATVPIVIERDMARGAAVITIDSTTVVLAEGEWSDWINVRFPLLPMAVDAAGIVRLYLKKTHGAFGLYVSPVNIDPRDPAVPISMPPDYSRSLVRELGYFYTQGIIEDTRALSAGVLSNEEYCQQALFVHEERLRFFQHELARFDRGFLFYYFSTLDLASHMFWRSLDEKNPLYTPDLARGFGGHLGDLYHKVDEAIGLALERLNDGDWLIVLSDHGFAPFRRQFNLNSWLLDEGYLQTDGPPIRTGEIPFQGVDWSRTLAYGVGLNGLYLNRKGRENPGCVDPERVPELTAELKERLEAIRDPETGEAVIANVFRSEDIYHGPQAVNAPDLIVGYQRGYRASWDTILGGFPRQQILDNLDPWSGDHCIDPSLVPGVLLSSRALDAASPRLEDLAPTILAAMGAAIPVEMTGQPLEFA